VISASCRGRVCEVSPVRAAAERNVIPQRKMCIQKPLIRPFLVILFIHLSAEPAFANAGVPLIMVTFPGMLIALVPVILIEAVYISRRLPYPLKSSLKVCGISNLVSTLIGIPLAWGLYLLPSAALSYSGAQRVVADLLTEPSVLLGNVVFILFHASWIPPVGKGLHWMIPTATIVLLVPAFFVSWFIEHQISKRMLKKFEAAEVRSIICKANLMTYFLLLLITLGWLSYSLFDGSSVSGV